MALFSCRPARSPDADRGPHEADAGQGRAAGSPGAARGGRRSARASIAKAHGLLELLALADGRMDREEAVQLTSIRVRQYAKRQSTWFRHQLPQFGVFSEFGEMQGVVDKLLLQLDKMPNREAE
ncbi:MAG: hypothetical protein R3C97_04180 [Geminicoccaceae bacterium]